MVGPPLPRNRLTSALGPIPRREEPTPEADELLASVLAGGRSLLETLDDRQVRQVIDGVLEHTERLENHNRELRNLHAKSHLSQDEYRELFHVAPVGYLVLDRDGVIRELNHVSAAQLGAESGGLLDAPFVDFVEPNDRSKFFAHFRNVYRGGNERSTEIHLVSRDRRRFPVWMTSNVLPSRPDRVLMTIFDISERKEAEAALRLRDRCVDATNNGIVILHASREGLPVISCNPAFEHITGYRRADVLNRSLELLRGCDTDLETWARLQLALCRGQSSREVLECYRKNGVKFWAEFVVSPIADSGTLTHFVCVMNDITERVRSEQALRTSEERYRLISELTTHVAYSCVRDGNRHFAFEWLRGEYQSMTGYELGALKGFEYWLPIVHPDDTELARARLAKLAGGQADVAEFRIIKQDGSTAWVRDYARPMRDPRSGEVDRIYGAARDITDEKRAEHEISELEEQLRQSTKMEAVGRLAGGVAHDFNNLLTTIMGNASILQELPPELFGAIEAAGESPLELAEEIYQAAARASQLTRQLLAFSRKQILKPELVDLSGFLQELVPMLRRLIREDVSLHMNVDSRACWIRGDRGQIHQIVVNLCVNAQDAMPLGGRIELRTDALDLGEERVCDPSVVPPGRYAVLSVCDTGEGISADVQRHIFEPFFTTKDVGEGTGLGLSTVYGIVHQSGGYVAVESEPRKGTRFDVYFPRLEEPSSTGLVDGNVSSRPRGQECVLVVEDEPGVRRLLCQVLEAAGYTVISASNGREALGVLDDKSVQLDLVVTDVIMPLMGGKQLAEQVEIRSPGTRILFISGYTNDAIARQGVIDEEVNFLQKPFVPSALTEKVREVLDQTSVETG